MTRNERSLPIGDRRWWLAAAAIVVLLAPGLARANAFVTGTTARPTQLALADFDEDGYPDAACGYDVSGRGLVTISPGRGEGEPFDRPVVARDLPESPAFVVAGDLDADGHADIAAASEGGRTVWVLSGDGRGGLERAVTIDAGLPIRSLEVAEVGRPDGLPDLIVGVAGGRSVAFASPEGATRAAAAFDVEVATRSAFGLRWNADALADDVYLVPGRETPAVVVTKASATFAVTTTADGGPGSLRQAILDANASPGTDLVTFAIAGTAPFVVAPLTPLPPVADTLTIDATTQPGAEPGVPVIVLSGASAPVGADGLTLEAPACTVRGLGIVAFPGSGLVVRAPDCVIEGNVVGAGQGNGESGIVLDGASNTTVGGTTPAARNVVSGNGAYGIFVLGGSGNRIQGNFVGTNAAGSAALANAFDGVLVAASSNNVVGGTAPGAGNVISGNGAVGVYVDAPGATGNIVQGNFIGLDATGAVRLGNGAEGVFVDGAGGNTVGGTTPAARNVISANGLAGVTITDPDATDNLVQGNFVGTDATGLLDRGNALEGVYLLDAPENTIGGAVAGARNVLSGNDEEGVEIFGALSAGNRIEGNYVGVAASGDRDLGNRLAGIRVDSAPSNTVGGGNTVSGNDGPGVEVLGADSTGNAVAGNRIGTDATGTAPIGNALDGVVLGNASGETLVGGTGTGAGNVVAFNGGAGVFVESGSGNTVSANTIFGNIGLGVDLAPAGPTPNDAGDADGGANLGQNAPTLSRVAGASVEGTLDAAPNVSYRVEFFSSAGCDDSGRGEGSVYLGSATVTTDADGHATISAVLAAAPPAGHVVTATASGAVAGTSEFSGCVAATRAGTADLSISVAGAPDPVASGGEVVYTLAVTNAGPDAAEGVTVTSETPQATVFVSATASQGSCATPETGAAGPIACALGTIAAGATATATLVVRVEAEPGARVEFAAEVASGSADPDAQNNQASTETDVEDAPPPPPPPVVADVRALAGGKPFRIKITGSNFQPGVRVFVGGDEAAWANVKAKGTTALVLRGGRALKRKFPAGTAVGLRIVNPDGGEVTASFSR
jgi:uncharacterized repeat protein (TIGR01451 family)